ncbi:MAG: PH domain-containing protein [Synergistaceae bacterium]|jgi:uncharacterized membrane protein YdbT with pleckstrin-like domain|nr:PH domain-containing protein [Synergistaceae bacterium]
MGKYIDMNLGRDEEVIFRAKVHWAIFIPDVILMFIFIGFITIIFSIIKFFTTELGFTNKRLVGKMGLINTKSMDSPLNKINNTSVSSGLFGKIFGFGNVAITTSSGAYMYKGIAQPEFFRSALMRQIEKYDEDRIKKQATEMASAIRGTQS